MKRWWVAALLIAIAILLQQFAQIPIRNAFTNSLSNWMHVPLFTGITAVLLWIRPALALRIVVAIMLALAVASELLQLVTGGQASISDLLRDLLGAGIALAFLRGREHSSRPGALRVGLAIIVTLLTTTAVPSSYLFAYQQQRNSFPVLYRPGDFSNQLLTYVHTATGNPAQLTKNHQWMEYKDVEVLDITWADTRWPGVHLQEPVKNWQEFDYLVVDVFNFEEAKQSFTAGVRHQGWEGTARYSPGQISPGHNRIRINVNELALLDNGEPATITHLILYTNQEHAGQRILLGQVWLE